MARGQVLSLLVSPDESRVVYRADQHTDGMVELYASNLDGTGNVKFNAPLPVGLDVTDFAVQLVQ